MNDLIRDWDGEHVVVRHDAESGAWIFIAVHSSKLGPPTGGTRMKTYSDRNAAIRDALRLAEGMTYKWAVLGVPRGGAKGVIDVPEGLGETARERLLRGYGCLLEALAGGFETGPDLGTGPAEMDIIAGETSHVFGRSPERGGAGDPGPYTALGVHAGMKALCGPVFGTEDLRGRTVLVQGAGHVGEPLMRRLKDEGAEVFFSDTDEPRVAALRKQGYRPVAPEEAYDQEVDLFAPCAIGGILNSETVPRLKCRVVAGSANNQLGAPEDAERLRERGIVYAPDYVINAGGAIFLPAWEGAGRPLAEIEERVRGIGKTLLEIRRRSEAEGISMEQAARRLAEVKLG